MRKLSVFVPIIAAALMSLSPAASAHPTSPIKYPPGPAVRVHFSASFSLYEAGAPNHPPSPCLLDVSTAFNSDGTLADPTV